MRHSFISPGFGALVPYVVKDLPAGDYTYQHTGPGQMYMFGDASGTAVQGLDLVFTLAAPGRVFFRPIGDVGAVSLLQKAPESVYQGGSGGIFANGTYLLAGFARLNGEGQQTAFGRLERPLQATIRGIGAAPVTGRLEIAIRAKIDGISGFVASAIVFQDIGTVFVPVTPPYRVVVYDLNGVPLEEMPFSDLNYSFVLNDAGAIDFSVPKNHSKVTPDILAPGKRTIQVYRSGRLVWGGYLWAVDASSDSEKVRVAGKDWFSRLERRYIDPDLDGVLFFEDTPQFDIAWGIISFIQTKESYGITRQAGPAGKQLRTVRYHASERVIAADALREFTEYDQGFDFVITAAKEWQVFHPQKGKVTDISVELGGMAASIDYTIDADDLTTEVTALGQGSGKNRCMTVITEADIVGSPRREYGLLQTTHEFPNTRKSANLNARAQEIYNSSKRPLWQPSVKLVTGEPPFGSYELGDKLLVKGSDGFLKINKKFRVVAISHQVTESGREITELTFDDAMVPA